MLSDPDALKFDHSQLRTSKNLAQQIADLSAPPFPYQPSIIPTHKPNAPPDTLTSILSELLDSALLYYKVPEMKSII